MWELCLQLFAPPSQIYQCSFNSLITTHINSFVAIIMQWGGNLSPRLKLIWRGDLICFWFREQSAVTVIIALFWVADQLIRRASKNCRGWGVWARSWGLKSSVAFSTGRTCAFSILFVHVLENFWDKLSPRRLIHDVCQIILKRKPRQVKHI